MNKKVMGLIILGIFFLALTVNGAENGTKWEVFVDKDVMTGDETWIAASPEASTMEGLNFSNFITLAGVRARLCVGYDGEKEWVFVTFSIGPYPNEYEYGSEYDIINTRIKWDNKVETIQLHRDWKRQLNILKFPDDKDYVSKIIESKTMVLELDWFMVGFVHFKFPLEGAAEAIEEIHKKFDISKNNSYSYDIVKSSNDLFLKPRFQVISRDITFTICEDLSVDFATKVEILTENERDYETLVEGFNTPDEEKLSLFQQSLDNLKEQIPRDFVVLSYESTVNSNYPMIYVDETVKLEGLVYRNNKGNIEFSLPGQLLSAQNEQVTVRVHYPYRWEVLSVNPTPTYIEQNVIGYSYTGVFGYPTIEFKGAENETKWTVSVSTDEMTGEETWYALSPEVSPTEPIDLPSEDIKAVLSVGYDGENEWVCIWFNYDVRIYLNDAEYGGEYYIINTRIRWDDKVEDIQLYIDWKRQDNILNFPTDKDYVSKIIESNMMVLELDWLGEGNVYFQFPLEGAAEAIDEIHKKFSE
jgi:predicted  nucleic acid-binding Zn-ribbon protein